jgi:hypothetical protein
MRAPFVDKWAFDRWASRVASAIRMASGRLIDIPPYAFPTLVRDLTAIIPAPTEVPPELVTDWGALIDELNTAITESVADAPARFSAEDMPDLILKLSASPLKFKQIGTFAIVEGKLVAYDIPVSIPAEVGSPQMLLADCSALARNSGAPCNSSVYIENLTYVTSQYTSAVEGGILVSYFGFSNASPTATVDRTIPGHVVLNFDGPRLEIAITNDAQGTSVVYSGIGTLYLASF